jgi:hypothetical protein
VTAVALYEKLPSDVRAILRIGRQARNEIAHELTLSIAEEIQNEEGRRTFFAAIAQHRSENRGDATAIRVFELYLNQMYRERRWRDASDVTGDDQGCFAEYSDRESSYPSS